MRGSYGKLGFSEKERGKVWKDYMKKIIDEENEWDHNVEGDTVQGRVVCVSREEVVQALTEMKTGKKPGPSDVSVELIATSGREGIQVKAEICQSPRWIWNASEMDSKHSGTNHQMEW